MLAFSSASRRCARFVTAALVLALSGCSDDLGEGSLLPEELRGQERSAEVTRHTDGDTLWLSGIGKVRLIGIDTPEVFGGIECFGRRASRFVERTAPVGARVRYRLGIEQRDRYGRALAYVWLADGRFLNRLLLLRGLAQPLTIPPNVEYALSFARAARRAREAERGLWGREACRGSR
jgi:micrococcal nuclease